MPLDSPKSSSKKKNDAAKECETPKETTIDVEAEVDKELMAMSLEPIYPDCISPHDLKAVEKKEITKMYTSLMRAILMKLNYGKQSTDTEMYPYFRGKYLDLMLVVKYKLKKAGKIDDTFDFNPHGMETGLSKFLQWFPNLKKLDIGKDTIMVVDEYMTKVKPPQLKIVKLIVDESFLKIIEVMNKWPNIYWEISLDSIIDKQRKLAGKLVECKSFRDATVLHYGWYRILADNYECFPNMHICEMFSVPPIPDVEMNAVALFYRHKNFRIMNVYSHYWHRLMTEIIVENQKQLNGLIIHFELTKQTIEPLTIGMLVRLLTMPTLCRAAIHFSTENDRPLIEYRVKMFAKVMKMELPPGIKLKHGADRRVKDRPVFVLSMFNYNAIKQLPEKLGPSVSEFLTAEPEFYPICRQGFKVQQCFKNVAF